VANASSQEPHVRTSCQVGLWERLHSGGRGCIREYSEVPAASQMGDGAVTGHTLRAVGLGQLGLASIVGKSPSRNLAAAHLQPCSIGCPLRARTATTRSRTPSNSGEERRTPGSVRVRTSRSPRRDRAHPRFGQEERVSAGHVPYRSGADASCEPTSMWPDGLFLQKEHLAVPLRFPIGGLAVASDFEVYPFLVFREVSVMGPDDESAVAEPGERLLEDACTPLRATLGRSAQESSG